MLDALMTAAENGKHVTAVIELKARFDEKKNINWARRLERAGVNVVFGFIGFKTHAKATLIIRREDKELKHYVHFATGNYNPSTAKLYSDIGVFTCDQEIGHDISAFFNLLTGFNVLTGESKLARQISFPQFSVIRVAPIDLRRSILELIDREIRVAKEKGDGLIFAKMNALVDKAIIEKLYEASTAGVKIRLLVRGICCLKPKIPGLSDNIEVTSIGRGLLEHSRIFYFQGGGANDVFISSADWMPRNMVRRVEIMVPIKDENLKDRILRQILPVQLEDNVKARVLQPNGTYLLRTRDDMPPLNHNLTLLIWLEGRALSRCSPPTRKQFAKVALVRAGSGLPAEHKAGKYLCKR